MKLVDAVIVWDGRRQPIVGDGNPGAIERCLFLSPSYVPRLFRRRRLRRFAPFIAHIYLARAVLRWLDQAGQDTPSEEGQ